MLGIERTLYELAFNCVFKVVAAAEVQDSDIARVKAAKLGITKLANAAEDKPRLVSSPENRAENIRIGLNMPLEHLVHLMKHEIGASFFYLIRRQPVHFGKKLSELFRVLRFFSAMHEIQRELLNLIRRKFVRVRLGSSFEILPLRRVVV